MPELGFNFPEGKTEVHILGNSEELSTLKKILIKISFKNPIPRVCVCVCMVSTQNEKSFKSQEERKKCIFLFPTYPIFKCQGEKMSVRKLLLDLRDSTQKV